MTNEQTEQPEIEQEAEEQHSRIVIEFVRPGDAEPQSLQCYSVTPGQLHAAAKRLELMADRHVQMMWAAAEREQMQKMAEMARVQEMIKGGVA